MFKRLKTTSPYILLLGHFLSILLCDNRKENMFSNAYFQILSGFLNGNKNLSQTQEQDLLLASSISQPESRKQVSLRVEPAGGRSPLRVDSAGDNSLLRVDPVGEPSSNSLLRVEFHPEEKLSMRSRAEEESPSAPFRR
jgi:hypothetical protein